MVTLDNKVYWLMTKSNDFESKTGVVFEKTTSLGTTVRSVLEPVGGERVRILEYHRKPKHGAHFRRVKSEEGKTLPFAQLGLTASYHEFFEFAKAA